MRLYSISTCLIVGLLDTAPKLCGVASQGGLLYGESETHRVYVNGNNMSMEDVFTIPLSMDAPDIITLEFCERGLFGNCRKFDYAVKQRQYKEQKVEVADKYVKYPPEVLARMEKDKKKIGRARRTESDGTAFMDMRSPLPLDKFQVSGVYGSRRIFNGEPKNPHNGLDLAAPRGTEFRAAAAGRVVLADDLYMTGNTIFIDHGNRIFSAYFHADELKVKVGDEVSADTIIGKVGSTGRSSGPHLHLGIYHHNIALDPEFFIK
ncbi:MAG: M23 family metallopeptidase [Rickettsiales bacterium]|jgi:murein DD-endopeptidase MepM/ murein hydrolase activator NlpD|nr:M23 family metallopeptidase [Rickettsiales bacterium]